MLHLDWCSHRAARYACKAWHYSRSLPTPPLVKLGVWEHGAFVGCVLFSRGANRHLGKSFGLRQTEVCELSRIALREHHAPVSRIVAIAVRLLHQRCPGLRLIVSFADPERGHLGTIYQAAGWLYLGTSAPSHVFVDGRGRRWHPRMVSKTGVKRVYGARRRVVRVVDCTSVDVAGKHRYALPLDAEMQARLLALTQPYPTRERSRENAAAGPPAEGGVSPTRSLHPHEGAHV